MSVTVKELVNANDVYRLSRWHGLASTASHMVRLANQSAFFTNVLLAVMALITLSWANVSYAIDLSCVVPMELAGPEDVPLTPDGLKSFYERLNSQLPGKTKFERGFIYRKDPRNGYEIGHIKVTPVGPGEIEVISVSVKDEYRKKGIATLLYLEALKLYPDSKAITGDLMGKNESIYFEGRNRLGLSVEDALRRAPSVKIRMKLGFTKIIYVGLSKEQKIRITLARP